ncbi:MAG: hypothetical protein JWO82_292 [Akkermansiaceae bacterium]|nr:hypothetical protein [Akkermansiaceae bacterium]
MRNHLFIGLGGQGGRSLAELRKVMEQRSKDVTQIRELGQNWEFLSIDSSSDVWNSGKAWKYFGKDLSLTQRQMLSLDRLSQAGGLAIRPDVAPWIGETSVVDSYLAGNRQIQGANQRRRFGRLLFANNADQINRGVQDQVATLTRGAAHQCWFHIFASLAGGTGSGGIVDLVTSIRSQFPNGDTQSGFPIFLYLYITHNEGAAADVGYFYQNQYAALRDLNALVCGRLRPTQLGSQHAGAPFEQNDPVTSLSLFSSLNSRNVNQPLDNQIRIATESCFERLYSFASGGLSPSCQKALTGEDILATFPGEPVQRPERSYRFASSGMRRWEVPSEKITEAVSLDLVIAGINQMLFNNWQEVTGYSDATIDLLEQRLGSMRSTLLTLLNQRSLATSRDAFAAELRKEFETLEKGVLNSDADQKTIEGLETKYAEFFAKEFRGGGTKTFFQNIGANRRSVIKELMTEVDELLTRTWKDAAHPIGLNQLPGLLASLGEALRHQIATESEISNQRVKLSQRCDARKLEWTKLTRLSRLAGKDTALLKAQSKDLIAQYGFHFADLCREQDVELQKDLLGEVQKLSASYMVTIQTAHLLKTEAVSERDEIIKELRSMQNGDGANRYEFDIVAVERFREELRKHQAHQSQAAHAMRLKLIPDHLKLSRFQDEQIKGVAGQSLEAIDNDLRQIAADRVAAVHHEFVSAGTIKTVLNASLLDYLQQRFTGNDAQLIREAKEFVELAASSLHLDPGEIQPAVLLGGGVGVPSMPKRVMVLGIPKHAFADKLRDAFAQVIPAGVSYVTDVYTHDDVTQLRLLVMDYWMAARFSTTAKELANKYTTAAKQNSTNNLLYFCNIDPDGEQGKRTELFLPKPETLKQKLEAELWLGQRLPVPAVAVDENGVFLVYEGPNGTDVESIGKTIEAVMSSASIPLMYKVGDRVGDGLARLEPAVRSKLKDAVRTEEERMLAQHKPTSPEFQHWSGLRNQLNGILG